MDQNSYQDWRSSFLPDAIAQLRDSLPEAVHRTHQRSARAYAEYQDPDGDQDVYGIAMAHGGQKELKPLISSVEGFHAQRVPRSRREVFRIQDKVLFMLRVGKVMPRNHRRCRLNYLPESRRELFEQTSNVAFTEPGALFELPRQVDVGDGAASLADAAKLARADTPDSSLFVMYYSSTPLDVGSMYWGPARLRGRYLEFTDPERLVYGRDAGTATTANSAGPRLAGGGFASEERPTTSVKLRRPKNEGEGGNGQ